MSVCMYVYVYMYALLSLKSTEQKLPIFLLLFELYKIANENSSFSPSNPPPKLTIIDNFGSAVSDFSPQVWKYKTPSPAPPSSAPSPPSVLLPPPLSSGFTVECLDFRAGFYLTSHSRSLSQDSLLRLLTLGRPLAHISTLAQS